MSYSIDVLKHNPDLVKQMTDDELKRYRACYAHFQSTRWLVDAINIELETRRNEPRH